MKFLSLDLNRVSASLFSFRVDEFVNLASHQNFIYIGVEKMTVDAFNALRVPYSIAFNVIRFCQLPRALFTLCLLTLPLIAPNVPFVSQRSLPRVLPSDLMFVNTTFEYHQSQAAWCKASSDLLIAKGFCAFGHQI